MAPPSRATTGARSICALHAPCDEWLALRRSLWPDDPDGEQHREMAALAGDPRRHAQFLARDGRGVAVGLLEATLRSDYVNGTASSPVAFLEGVYVAPRSGAADTRGPWSPRSSTGRARKAAARSPRTRSRTMRQATPSIARSASPRPSVSCSSVASSTGDGA